jgi:hypothetical protein
MSGKPSNPFWAKITPRNMLYSCTSHAAGDEKTMGNEKSKLPTYEVEFIPVERRLVEGRRKSSGKTRQNIGIEKRGKSGRRDTESGHKPIK